MLGSRRLPPLDGPDSPLANLATVEKDPQTLCYSLPPLLPHRVSSHSPVRDIDTGPLAILALERRGCRLAWRQRCQIYNAGPCARPSQYGTGMGTQS